MCFERQMLLYQWPFGADVILLGYPDNCGSRKKYFEVVRYLLESRLVLHIYKESTCYLYFKCFCVTCLIFLCIKTRN